jgi:hypothetical protein
MPKRLMKLRPNPSQDPLGWSGTIAAFWGVHAYSWVETSCDEDGLCSVPLPGAAGFLEDGNDV